MNILIGFLIGIVAYQIYLAILDATGAEPVFNEWLVIPVVQGILTIISVLIAPFYFFFRGLFVGWPKKYCNSAECKQYRIFPKVYLVIDKKASRWLKKIFLVRVKGVDKV